MFSKRATEIVSLCVEQNGSITGEHGVGIEKRAYMPVMYSGAELAAMHDLKSIMDPRNLLNPGKIFPDELPEARCASPVMPNSEIFAPTTAEEAAAGLLALASAGRSVRIGSAAEGEKRGADVWLTTDKLDSILKVAPDDLYVTAGAGIRLDELQEVLRNIAYASAGGCPLAPSHTRWTARCKYQLAAAHALWQPARYCAGHYGIHGGRASDCVRAGPLSRMWQGTTLQNSSSARNGTLGLLVDVTLKLTPLPRARRSLAVYVKELRTGLAVGRANRPTLAGHVRCCRVPGSCHSWRLPRTLHVGLQRRRHGRGYHAGVCRNRRHPEECGRAPHP